MSIKYTLKAMCENYGDGPHKWDKLDKEACLAAVTEITDLEDKIKELEDRLEKISNIISPDSKWSWDRW